MDRNLDNGWKYNKRRRKTDRPTLEELGREVDELREVLDGVLTAIGASVYTPYYARKFSDCVGRNWPAIQNLLKQWDKDHPPEELWAPGDAAHKVEGAK